MLKTQEKTTATIRKALGIDILKPIIIDMEGRPKGLLLNGLRKNIDLTKGIYFDGSSIKGHTEIYDSDLVAKPDHETIIKENVNNRIIATVLCHIEKPNGTPYLNNPRTLLIEYTGELEKKGLKPKVGAELEYFLIKREEKKLKPYDRDEYFSVTPYTQTERFQIELLERLDRIGIIAEKTHHEVAPGQYELALKASTPLKLADNITITKMEVKKYAKKIGLTATFMPKPFQNSNGSGLHIHISLQDKDGNNLFYNKEEDKHSETALHAIGGILKNAKNISMIVAPTVNSYKRLAPGYEAPTKICWGYRNRSAMIRIPGQIDEDKCRIEYRHPDPSCNPYLTLITILESAINGISEKIDPGPPFTGNAYKTNMFETLPKDLGEAITKFREYKNSTYIHSLREKLIKMKMKEWSTYLNHVKDEETKNKITEWEIDRYLEKT